MTLLFKEMKKIVFSVVFIAYVFILLFFIESQTNGILTLPHKPECTDESFGRKYSEDYSIIIPKSVTKLYYEYMNNSYITYPHGLYKNIRLNEYKKFKVANILTKLTCFTETELGKEELPDITENDISITNKEDFLMLMKEVDNILGRGSNYDESNISQFGMIPMTYEDAVADYELIVKKDKYWGTIARLLSDYLGIALAILPIFPAMWLVLKDKRSHIQEVLYTKRVSSFKIISTRYLALVIVTFMPILYFATKSTIVLLHISEGLVVDYLAFYKYSFGWLLPTLMFSTALSILVTELTDTPLVILVGGIVWYVSLSSGTRFMDGSFCGMNLIPRCNSISNIHIFLDSYTNLVVNRIFYLLISLVLVVITIYIYELKRRGKINGWFSFKKIFRHNNI